MSERKNPAAKTAFREMIYRDWLWYIGCDNKHQIGAPSELHWAAMYHYIKHELALPIADWKEAKIWNEMDFSPYVGFVRSRDLESAQGQNPLGIIVPGAEGENAKEVICWARVCLKIWFAQIGVNSSLLREILELSDRIIIGPLSSTPVLEEAA